MVSFQGSWILARKELGEHFTSKRFFILGGLFAVSIVLATTLGGRLFRRFAEVGGADVGAESVPMLLNLYLTMFQGILLLKILALVLAADAVVSEWKDRTLFLLLSKPITRTGMLTGKIIAAYLTVLLLFVGGFTVGLVVLMFDVGVPDAEGWGRILGGLGILAVGLLPFVALATMFSTLFKSTATSYTISIIVVMLVLPIVFTIIFFAMAISQGFMDATSNETLAYIRLIDPSAFLDAASIVMVDQGMGMAGGVPVQTGDVATYVGASFAAMAVHLLVYLGVSYWMVNRRDYA